MFDDEGVEHKYAVEGLPITLKQNGRYCLVAMEREDGSLVGRILAEER